LVIPVGLSDGVQQLVVYEKEPSGELVGRHHLPVRFVPVTGGHGR
jgi:protein-L-isoaspartate(D-aspartate) O-methyltransferase